MTTPKQSQALAALVNVSSVEMRPKTPDEIDLMQRVNASTDPWSVLTRAERTEALRLWDERFG